MVRARRPCSTRLRPRPGRSRPSGVTHVEQVPPRSARPGGLAGLGRPDVLVDRLRARAASTQPWAHQAAAADAGLDGPVGRRRHRHRVRQVAGLPAAGARPRRLDGRRERPRSTSSPTKALAADQLRALRGSDARRRCAPRPTTATPRRTSATGCARTPTYVLTNPDMLHRSLLPGPPALGARSCERLRFVVVDECHGYRGVFGSHVAQVLRRLRRVARPLRRDAGVRPRLGDRQRPGDHARAADRPATSRRSPTTARRAADWQFALWEPPLSELPGEHGAPVRRSATAEAADLLADLVVEGSARSPSSARGAAPRRSRSTARRAAGRGRTRRWPRRVAAYRAGYLPEERRALERALHDRRAARARQHQRARARRRRRRAGRRRCIAGWPGTRASLWQQAGRAGRAGQDALAVLVARDDPLDTYLVHHPEALFGRPVEADGARPGQPLRARARTCAPPPPSCR